MQRPFLLQVLSLHGSFRVGDFDRGLNLQDFKDLDPFLALVVLPGGHGVQVVDPVWLLYVSGSQGLHFLLGMSWYVPRGHFTHLSLLFFKGIVPFLHRGFREPTRLKSLKDLSRSCLDPFIFSRNLVILLLVSLLDFLLSFINP